MHKRALKASAVALVLLTAASAAAYTYTTQVTLKFADDVGAAVNSGTLIIGNSTGRQIGFDDNEIQARAANGGASILYLQHAGGDLDIGSTVINLNPYGILTAGGEQLMRINPLQSDPSDGLTLSVFSHVNFQEVVSFTGNPRILFGAPQGGPALCLSGNGYVGTCASSRRFKTDIAAVSSGLREVMAMKPMTFSWKQDGRPDLGFIAEDAAEVVPALVVRDAQGQIQGFNYQHYTALLTRAVQEQQTTIEGLRAQGRSARVTQASELAARDRQIDDLRRELDETKQQLLAQGRQVSEMARAVAELSSAARDRP
jgi:hypothetical protein